MANELHNTVNCRVIRKVLQLPQVPCSQVCNGLFSKVISFSRLDIALKLHIPLLCFKLLKPLPETSKFLRC